VERREFLTLALLAPTGVREALARPSSWRSFEIDVGLAIQGARGTTRAWLPLPLARPTDYQKSEETVWTGNASSCRVVRDESSGADILCAEWPDWERRPALELTMRVSTADVHVPLDEPRSSPAEPDLSRYLEPTALIPTDGIVRETAAQITRGHRSELSRARAIYDWIVEHTFRDPAVRGCGVGDIRFMLETGNLGGKCADLNALFVGLARGAGLPARDVYGIRVASSSRFSSLGKSGTITTAQHCRAEVHLSGFGWVPVDPADVRKVALEERPGAALDDPHIQSAREQLFGSWEMNWIAFNDAHDVALPGSAGKALPFLMYPQAEIEGTRKDSLDPETFRYAITSRELTGAEL
jgi:transglutaminase-like putative cysteine protease